MKFQSTRDNLKKEYTASKAILKGLCDDGGLFVPTEIPKITKEDIDYYTTLDYPTLASKVLGLYLEDYTEEELLEDCKKAYSEASFVGGAAPLSKISDTAYSLELWHGPTSAFKDMALQIMPRLLSRALKKNNEKRTSLILVATSGDTGKAALEGYKDIDGIKIMVFYPQNGVSRVQKLQMATQSGENVNVCAINGNFDDAQNGVKKIFSDNEFAKELDKKGYFLSSANSINWGRLAPQIVYYIYAYATLIKKGEIKNGDEINVCVPTGNFGNIFAAYLAKKMGLPINKFICASNKNNILTDFLRTGVYDRNRDFHLTMSPSMDILISSNLERLLYFTVGIDKTKKYMEDLKKDGRYSIDKNDLALIQKDFVGYYTDEASTASTIKKYYFDENYLMDTHTSVAFYAYEQYEKDSGDTRKTVIASTASPYKFAKDVFKSLYGKEPTDELSALSELSKSTKTEIPYPLVDIQNRKIRFEGSVDKEEMPNEVLKFVK